MRISVSDPLFVMYSHALVLVMSVCLFSCKQKPDTNPVYERPQTADSVQVDRAADEEIKKSRLVLSLERQGLVDIHDLDETVLVDLKYATVDNFTNTVLYDSLFQAYLHPVAAEKLIKAQDLLKEIHPGYSLLIYDAARPLSVQRKMYDVVRNTSYQAYVANPERVGMHNYGMAVDITVADADGVALDMGTPFDFFGRAAGINQEDQLMSEGVLSREQVDNRRLLRKVMTEAGFITIRGEWWHFNAVSHSQAKNISKVIE